MPVFSDLSVCDVLLFVFPVLPYDDPDESVDCFEVFVFTAGVRVFEGNPLK